MTHPNKIPDPEVPMKSARPRYTAAYKRKVLEELEKLPAGQVGAYLRKQGLYSGTVSRWRWESESTTMGSVAHRKPGPKPQKTAEEAEIARLQRRIAALEDKLEVAHEIIAVQKKISEIFSGLSPKTPNDNSDTG